METTVTTKNLVSIPQAIAKVYGIRPGWKLEWERGEREDEIIVHVIPDRTERARRLMGSGARYSSSQSAVDGLVAERENEG